MAVFLLYLLGGKDGVCEGFLLGYGVGRLVGSGRRWVVKREMVDKVGR